MKQVWDGAGLAWTSSALSNSQSPTGLPSTTGHLPRINQIKKRKPQWAILFDAVIRINPPLPRAYSGAKSAG